MADRVVGDFASDISAPFNDQPAGDRLTTSRQATAAAPISSAIGLNHCCCTAPKKVTNRCLSAGA